MKTNTFSEKLERILEQTHLQGRKDPDGYGSAIESGKQSIIDLVLNDVIGEDEPADKITDPEIWLEEVSKNRLRAVQRAIIKGGNHEA